jgi:hypothetical protein
MDNRNNRNPNGGKRPQNTSYNSPQRRRPANYRQGGTSNTTTVVAVLIVIALFKILSVPFLEPRANSSAQSFVTAVEIPEVAKVEIKT